MQIAKVITARGIRVFDIEELNPQGRDLMPMLVAVRQRYRFLQGPEKREDLELAKGVKFFGGSFRPRDADISVDLEIYSDGIVANTRSDTAEADAIIDDLLHWAWETYGIGNENYILKAKRLYRSELVVFAPNTRLGLACEKLSQFAQSVSIEGDGRVEITGFSMGGDSKNRLMFTFERRINVPFDEHKYYTTSLLPTHKHLELLDRFEKLF